MSVFTALHRLVPVPNYLRLPSVGVDISDSSLKYIQFTPDYSHDRLTLAHWGDIDVAEGTLVQGDIREPKGLVAALREVHDRTGVPYVRISLPEERAYIFETTLKRGIAMKEIRGALEFRLEENVPIPPQDAYFDYEILSSSADSSAFKVSVTVYARETINDYYEAARAADLVPLAFEVEAAAIARSALPVGEQGTHMLVDFGKTRTGIGIVHHGTLMYTSTIDVGGQALSQAVRQKIGDLEESEITELKNSVGLLATAEHTGVSDAFRAATSEIVDELKLRLQYWETHAEATLPDHDVRSIFLCGGSSNLKGLPAFLEEALDISTTRAQVWRNAFLIDEYVPPIDLRHSYGYATAIGLALAGHIAFYD